MIKTYKIYIKRKTLTEKIFNIRNPNELYILKFLLKNELIIIRHKLREMQEDGLIKNISMPGKRGTEDLVRSRKSILDVLNRLRKV